MECLFCSIVSGKIPALKVQDDESHLAFLDINPCSSGHTVVIPKKHYPRIEEMPKNEAEALFGFVCELEKSVLKAMGTDYCNIGANIGKLAGQEVPHVHVHIIPRYEGDGGTAVQGIVRMLSKKEDLPQIAEKIKSVLGGAAAPEEKKAEETEEKTPTGAKARGQEEEPKPEKEEKQKEPHKRKPKKTPERELQEFTHKHQDDVLDLGEARNL